MSSLNRLYGLLRPLGIYALGRGGLIDAELESYSAGFSLIEKTLGFILSGLFPQAATGEALAAHEIALGLPPRPETDDPSRRELILMRSRRPLSGTADGLTEAMTGCGLLAPSLSRESAAVLRLSAGGAADGLAATDALEMALRLLPAHFTTAIGQTWDILDASLHTWNHLDSLGRSWNEMAF